MKMLLEFIKEKSESNFVFALQGNLFAIFE
jgi:hypothetical protein